MGGNIFLNLELKLKKIFFLNSEVCFENLQKLVCKLNFLLILKAAFVKTIYFFLFVKLLLLFSFQCWGFLKHFFLALNCKLTFFPSSFKGPKKILST